MKSKSKKRLSVLNEKCFLYKRCLHVPGKLEYELIVVIKLENNSFCGLNYSYLEKRNYSKTDVKRELKNRQN